MTWTFEVGNNQFYSEIINDVNNVSGWTYSCHTVKYPLNFSMMQEYIHLRGINGKRVYFVYPSTTDASFFKTAMQGVYLYYELDNEILHNEGEEISLGRSNRNLLDNPWFTINQRGINGTWGSESSEIYGVDRWKNYYNSLIVNSDGTITIPAGSSLYQRVDIPRASGTQIFINQLLNKTLTMSAMLSNGSVVSGSAVIVPSRFIVFYGTSSTFQLYYDGDRSFAFYNRSSESVTVKAVKLELGSVSTLANDVAPDYREELLKCQRYFIRFSAGILGCAIGDSSVSTNHMIRLTLALSTTMRSALSVSMNDELFYSFGSNSGSATNPRLTVTHMSGNHVTISIISEDFNNNNLPYLIWKNNGYIDLSADYN